MLAKDRAVLIVVDIQDVLMPKSPEIVYSYLEQSIKCIRACRILGIPILVTEQYPERLGTSNTKILETLGDVPRYPKTEFGCLANAAFYEALIRTRRDQLLLIGMETHVCILQTALEALEHRYEVFLVRDAVVSSRKAEYKAGLARMVQAGVIPVSTEMVIFELLRRAGTEDFKALLPIIKGS